MINLSLHEYVILDNIDKHFKYISRDRFGRLMVHTVPPVYDEYSDRLITFEGNTVELCAFNGCFMSITHGLTKRRALNIDGLLSVQTAVSGS